MGLSKSTFKTLRGFLLAIFERVTKLRLKPKTLENIYNYQRISETLVTSGQPDAQELCLIAQQGYEAVINLAPQSPLENSLRKEPDLLADLAVEYCHIPVDFRRPTAQNFDEFCAAMNAFEDKKLWVHCAANMRVSAFIYCYQTRIKGEDPEQALARLHAIWRPSEVWQRFIDANGIVSD